MDREDHPFECAILSNNLECVNPFQKAAAKSTTVGSDLNLGRVFLVEI